MTAKEVLYQLKENGRFEAKSAQGGLPRSIWETYSAFANTFGGTIVFGLRELSDHSLEVVGVPNPEAQVKEFWDVINNSNKVSINLLVNDDVAIESLDDKSIVIIRVPRADRRFRPVFIDGNPLTGTFRRKGEGDNRCSPDECKAMMRDSGDASVDATVVESLNLSALCKESLAAYRNTFKASRPNHPWNDLSDEEYLLRLGAAARVQGDGELHPTRAGLLMFGYEYEIVKEYPNYFLDYREADGKERWSDRVVSNDGEWSGNIFDFWRKVSPRLVADLKTPFSLSSDMLRQDDTLMHKAVREGLVNALMHADYFGRRYIVVVKYADRIEFSNPGDMRIPADVALEGGISDARNAGIMKMFSLISACEKAGSGFDTMRRACEEVDAPLPSLEESYDPSRTKLVLFLGNASALVPHNASHNQVFTKKTAQSYDSDDSEPKMRVLEVLPGDKYLGNSHLQVRDAASMSNSQIEYAVVSLAKEQGAIRRQDVEHLLSIGSTKAKGILSKLVKNGVLEVEGAGRSTKYKAV